MNTPRHGSLADIDLEQRERARRREQLLEGENEILKLIIDNAPLPAVFDALIRVAERQSSHGLLASILLLDSDRVHLRHGAAPSLPAAYNQAIDGVAIGPNAGSCGTAAFLRAQVIVADILEDPLWEDFRHLALLHGLRACWSTPILSASRTVLGTFALYYRHPRAPDADDQAMIEILTRTAALAIEHSRAESELAESEERFRSLSRCAPVGVFMVDATGSFTYVNPRFIETAAYDYEKTFEYWIESATRQRPPESLLAAVRTCSEFSGEFVVGEEKRHVSLRIAPLKSHAGSYLGYVGTIEDVTRRISDETALKKETSLRKAIEESIPAGIAVVGTDQIQTYVNPAFAAMVGWPAEELIGARAPFVYWPPEELENIEKALRDTMTGSAPTDGFELRFVTRAGKYIDVLVSVASLKDEAGTVDGWVASVTDITERKRAQQNLARSEARLAMALEAGHMGAWEWDIPSGRVSWSAQLEAIHGLAPGSFGGTFEDFQSDMNPDHKGAVLSAIRQALENRAEYHAEYEIIRPDQSRAWVEAHGRALCDLAGNPQRMVGVCMDVTYRKLAASTGS